MSLTPFPPSPSRGDDPDNFSAETDAFLGHFPVFVGEVNLLATDLDQLKIDVQFIKDDAILTPTLSMMKTRTLELPKDFKKFSIFFSRLNLQWDPDYSSFVSTKEVNGLGSINGEMLNKLITSSVEIKMPSSEDDRLYIYIKAPNDNFYFFGYSQGILSITSNNTSFTDALVKLKKKELVYKMPNDETYEIQAVSPETADLFVQRVKSSGQPKVKE